MLVGEELSLLILLLTSSILIRVQAQQGIVLTSSGELCFGQTVTLTCTHPDPYEDPAKYLPVAIGFIENGKVLHIAEPDIAQRFTLTWLNSTASTVSFTVTEEYYASRVINYSCFLIPTGFVVEREESNQIAIDANVQAEQGIVLIQPEVPCFGQTVTLTCTHPDPLQNLVKYQPVAAISFTENGTKLDFSLPATLEKFNRTRLNSTASTLSFNVTEEDHANRVTTCSCFLVLNSDGGRKESNTITMNVDAPPPTIVSKPNSTSGLLQWRPSSCSNYQYIFTLTWVRIGDGSNGTVSTAKNSYNFTGMPGGEHTVSLQARVTNFNLSESQPALVQFNLTVSSQNVEGNVFVIALAAVSAVAGLFLIIMVLAVIIPACVLVRMRRSRREEGQERKRRDSREESVPITTNSSYVPFQHQKKTPLYENA